MKEDKHIERKFGKENKFSVPKDYFEELPSEIIQRINDENTKQEKPWLSFFQSKYILPTAFGLLALFIISKLFFPAPEDRIEIATFPEDVIGELSTAQIADLEDELFYENLFNEFADTSTLSIEHVEDDDALISYLIENEFDLQLLTEEY